MQSALRWPGQIPGYYAIPYRSLGIVGIYAMSIARASNIPQRPTTSFNMRKGARKELCIVDMAVL